MKITFAKLRNEQGWGIRGDKATGESLPEMGSTVTVHKRSGDTSDVIMGAVVAEGDDWWLAKIGEKPDRRPPGQRGAEEAERQPTEDKPPLSPPYDPNSHNATERRLAREQADEEVARRAEASVSKYSASTEESSTSGFDWGEEVDNG